MHKAPYVFPIVGGRKVEHLMDNVEALGISLTREQISYLDGILPFDKGFPNTLIVSGAPQSQYFHYSSRIQGEYGTYPWLLTSNANFDIQPLLPPVTPSVN